MLRSRPALSSATIIVAVLSYAGRAWAGAHERPHYALEGRHIVVEHDGFRDEIEIDCDDVHEMKHREDRLLVACGGAGIAIFSLDDPSKPRFVARKPTRGGPCVAIAADDTCIAKTEMIRTSVVVHAPVLAARAALCSLDGNVSVDGRVRKLDIVASSVRCASAPPPPDAFAVIARIEPIDESESRVILEHDPTDVVDDEIREVLARIADEVEGRTPRTWAILQREADRRKPPVRQWYGWQTLILDAGLVTCATVVLCPVALGTFLVGPPIVHGLHGHAKRGWFSLLVRGGPALAGMGTGILVGLAVSCDSIGCARGDPVPNGALIGVLAGAITSAVTAPILDAVVAYDDPPRPKVSPILVPGFVGMGGTF